jgi:hypothetical protein
MRPEICNLGKYFAIRYIRNRLVSTVYASLKGQCHEIFDLRFFPKTIPLGSLIHGLTHENFLLGSSFEFLYFFSGGVGQFGNIYVFDR